MKVYDRHLNAMVSIKPHVVLEFDGNRLPFFVDRVGDLYLSNRSLGLIFKDRFAGKQEVTTFFNTYAMIEELCLMNAIGIHKSSEFKEWIIRVYRTFEIGVSQLGYIPTILDCHYKLFAEACGITVDKIDWEFDDEPGRGGLWCTYR
jgi:hypothetical protein